jgi:uncharacterized protein YndB with AHSA1/START domain
MMLSSEGPTGPVIQLSGTFRAPRSKLFATWTEPELVKKWFFAQEGFRTPVAEVDLRPFGAWKIRVETPSGDPTNLYGNFIEVVPNERLTYSWTGACSVELYWTMVTVKFLDDGTGSKIQLTHGVFENETDRLAHEQGWFGCLEPFAALVESGP